MNWPSLYADEVAPDLARFAAPVPLVVRGLAAAGLIVGTGGLVLAPPPLNLAGMVPLLMVAFGFVMVRQGRAAVRNGEVVVRFGVVGRKEVKKVLTDSTTTGVSEARYVYVLHVEVERAHTLTEAGEGEPRDTGTTRMTISRALHSQLRPGDAIVAVSLPTAPLNCHFLVDGSGAVRR